MRSALPGTERPALDVLMRPRSVAVVGASPRPLHGSVALENLKQAGMEDLYVVNPRYDEVRGVPSYASIDALPAVPDCVILAVGKDRVLESLADAGARGVRAAVVFTAGFAEVGGDGVELEARLAEIAARHGMAVCGPNCMGLANLADAVPLYAGALGPPAAKDPAPNVAVIAQSGSVSLALMAASRLRCAYVVSTGNQTVVDATDYVAYCIADPRVDAVGIFLEAPRKPDRFRGVARAARESGTPLVVCKVGRSDAGRAATKAHTGALAGAYEVFEGICRQEGVILVEDLDALVETLVLVSGVSEFPETSAIAVANCSGGENALLIDLAEARRVEFATLTEETRGVLAEALPHFGHVANPLDVTGALVFDRVRYERAIDALVNDPNVGLGLVTQDIPRSASRRTQELFRPMIEATAVIARRSATPMAFLTTISGEADEALAGVLQRSGVPVLEGIDKGLRAVERLLWWSRRRSELAAGRYEPGDTVSVVGRRGLAAAVEMLTAAGDAERTLTEVESKRLLGELGFPVLPERLVAREEEAVRAAAELGYPVALKAVSGEILHKSDVGGVRLGLGDEPAVRVAFRTLAELAPAVVVQPMVGDSTELLLGMQHDPAWGPVVVAGRGGTMVEELRAVAFRRAPVGTGEVRSMLAEIPGAESLWRGRRGQAPRDVGAFERLVADFSAVCAALADLLQEIDLNPVMLHQEGRGATIVDALIVPRRREPANGCQRLTRR